MAQRGRKPKPVADKRMRGNPGGRSLAPQLPPAPLGRIDCPMTVEENPRARAFWDHYLQTTAPGTLAPQDAPLLGRLCLALAFADEATRKMEQAGLVIRAPNTGLPIQSPYLPIVNRQTEIARKLAAELGLTVAQRNRTGGAGDGAGDDGSDLLDG